MKKFLLISAITLMTLVGCTTPQTTGKTITIELEYNNGVVTILPTPTVESNIVYDMVCEDIAKYENVSPTIIISLFASETDMSADETAKLTRYCLEK